MDKKAVDNMKIQIQVMEHYSRVDTLKDLELEELFNPKFMHQHTFSNTIQQFLNSGGFNINQLSDFDKIPKSDIDAYVFKNTKQFETLEELILAARLFWLESHI